MFALKQSLQVVWCMVQPYCCNLFSRFQACIPSNYRDPRSSHILWSSSQLYRCPPWNNLSSPDLYWCPSFLPTETFHVRLYAYSFPLCALSHIHSRHRLTSYISVPTIQCLRTLRLWKVILDPDLFMPLFGEE
jgi:hypothetical protein